MLLFLLPALLVGYGLFELLDDDDDTSDPGSEGESVTGTDGNDVIETGEGDDSIFAQDGEDLIVADEGDDRVFGGDGRDVVFGEEGDDFLRGGGWADWLFAGEGEDTLNGDAGDDRLFGADVYDESELQRTAEQQGNQLSDQGLIDFDGDSGDADVLNGGQGDDDLFFGSNDTVTGGEGRDFFFTGEWVDPDAPPVITDFDPSTEEIVFYFTGDDNDDVADLFFGNEDENGDVPLIWELEDGTEQVVAILQNVDPGALSTDVLRSVVSVE